MRTQGCTETKYSDRRLLISDRYFAETRGSVTKVLVGLGQAAVDKAEAELLALYNDSVGEYMTSVKHLDQWKDIHVSSLLT